MDSGKCVDLVGCRGGLDYCRVTRLMLLAAVWILASGFVGIPGAS